MSDACLHIKDDFVECIPYPPLKRWENMPSAAKDGSTTTGVRAMPSSDMVDRFNERVYALRKLQVVRMWPMCGTIWRTYPENAVGSRIDNREKVTCDIGKHDRGNGLNHGEQISMEMTTRCGNASPAIVDSKV